ncbi:MAG: RDD family protein [Clostridia bacterium]|nr:RDD family protein [Clostridia bacterium]
MSITLQKASIWKRIPAYIFDMILTVIIALGVATATSSVVKYDEHNARMDAKYEQYEEKYNIDLDITQEAFDQLPQEIKDVYAEANVAFGKDPEVQEIQGTLFTLSLLIISVGAFVGIFIWYFVIPLLLKNGQTVGKKCFSLAVVRTNCVKISNPILFIRSMLGLYAIETMVPILMLLMLLFGALGSMALIVIGLILILQLIVMVMSSTNSSIHDLLSDTVVVDMSTQKIFESEEELIAYKEQQHAMQVAKAEGNYDEYTPVNLFGQATYRVDEDADGEENANEEINQSSDTEN